jgi:hypothetical protein
VVELPNLTMALLVKIGARARSDKDPGHWQGGPEE